LVNVAGFGALAGLAVGMSVHYGSLGDYEADAAPAFEALARGHLHEFFSTTALMGPFALLARAPFVLAAGLGDASMLDRYRWGAVACMLVSVVLALVVARMMRRAGQPTHACVFAAVLVVANPLVVKALRFGHPEEMLGAALCTGAMLAAMRRKGILAGILFALALATKQWALVMVGPMVLAVLVFGLPRWRFAAAVLITGLVVAGPFLLSDPRGYLDVQDRAGSIPVTSWQPASPYSLWYPLIPTKNVHIRPVDGESIVRVRPVPAFVAGVGKKLIVVSALLLSVPLILRRRRLSATDPLLFLALVLLLRCMLDPFDNPYYHLPFLFAFLTWEALSIRGVPVIALFVSFAFLLQTNLAGVFTTIPDYTTHCVVYLAWSLPALAFMALHLYSPAFGSSMRHRLTRALPSLGRTRKALAPAL
jgi:Glycosyltransferase family 87